MDLKNNYSLILVMVSFVLFLCVSFRVMVTHYKWTIPPNMFNIIMAIFIGVLMSYLPFLRDFMVLLKIAPQHLGNAYLGVYVISTIYHLDYHVFIRGLYQEIVISLMTTIITPLAFGTLQWYLIYPAWTFNESLLLTHALIPIEPSFIMNLLLELANHKYLSTILKAESLFTILPLYIYYTTGMAIKQGIITKWYHVLLMLVRYFVGGCIFGCIWGKLKIRLVLLFNHEPVHVTSISICMTFIGYIVAEMICIVAGPLAIFFMMLMFMSDKHRISDEVDEWLRSFWRTISYIVETYTIILCGIEVTIYAIQFFDFTQSYYVITWYFTGTMFSFARVMPLICLLNHKPYQLNLNCMLVLAYSNVKGAHSLVYVLALLGREELLKHFTTYLLPVLIYVLLSQSLNCILMPVLLKVLGMSDITTSRKTNMQNCISYIESKRECIIDLLKMKRYLANANWASVRKQSKIEYPYDHILDNTGDDNITDNYNDYLVTCPYCEKDIPYEHTHGNAAQIILNAHIKVLKAKKVALIRQYENGCVDKKCLQVLVHKLETLVESNSQNSINLKQYSSSSGFYHWLKTMILFLYHGYNVTPPKQNFRRFFYYLISHIAYDPFVYIITLSNAIFSVWNSSRCCNSWMLYYHYSIWCFYFLDFFITLISLSNGLLFISGIKHYFKFFSNKIDFILLLVGFINFFTTRTPQVFEWIIYIALPTYRTLSVIRLFLIIRIIGNFCPMILTHLDYYIDACICFDYECATSLVNCANDILYTLPQIVDSKLAMDTMQNALTSERDKLNRDMENIQKERPYISITVKTKQAIRTAKVAMEGALTGLMTGGFIDEVEYKIIFQQIIEKEKYLRNMIFVQPSLPQDMFALVPWLADDEVVMEYLLKNVQAECCDTNDVIMKRGRRAKGVYVVVTGMLRLHYEAMDISEINTFVPIIDNLATLELYKSFDDCIISGNSIGELSVMTGRVYDCTIVAATPSQGYWLNANVIKEAMKLSPNPIDGLEARIWKHCCLNLAIALMMRLPGYQSFTQEQVKKKLSRSFMPILRGYRVFTITDMMDELILIEGVVDNFMTGDKYTAPVVLPKNAKKLVLNRNLIINDQKVNAKLLIIPMHDTSAYDIMMREEIIGELVSEPSSICLLHDAQDLRQLQPHRTPISESVWSRDSRAASVYEWRKDLEIIRLDDSNEKNVMDDGSYYDVDSLTLADRRSSRFIINTPLRTTYLKPIPTSSNTSISSPGNIETSHVHFKKDKGASSNSKTN